MRPRVMKGEREDENREESFMQATNHNVYCFVSTNNQHYLTTFTYYQAAFLERFAAITPTPFAGGLPLTTHTTAVIHFEPYSFWYKR